MPFTQPHLLLNWSGPIGPEDRSDRWSGSLRLGQPGINWSEGELPPLNPDDFPTQLRDEILSHLRVLIRSTEMRIRSDAGIDLVKLNRIGIDGRYQSTTETTQWDTTDIGGTTAPTYPQQVAIVSTYRTTARRGPASTGRTYWPTAIAYNATVGGLADAARSGMAVQIAGFLNSLATSFYSAGYALEPVVMSNLRAGAINRIARVEVGSRFDIQRRRDNDDAEVYSGSNVPAPTPAP